MRELLWASFAALGFACNGNQFTDAGVVDATPDSPIISGGGGDGGDASVNCGDTQTSSTNCGACGHSCQGGSCIGGVCQPVVFASMSQGLAIDALALDDTNVYVGSDLVYACPRSGCGSGFQAITSLVYKQPGQQNIVGIAPFSQNGSSWMVYVNYGTIPGGGYGFAGKCPVGGCLDAGSGHIFDMNGASSAFVFGQTGYALGGTLIRQFPLDGGAPTTFAAMSSPLSVSAVDSMGHVAFCAPGQGVYACDTSSCASPTLLSPATTVAFSIAIYNGTVYWSDAATGLIDSCALTGCGNTPAHLFTTSPGAIGDIAVDANGRLFFAVNYAGSMAASNVGLIETCLVGSCSSPATLATNRNYPWHLVAGATVLYWSEGTQIGQATPSTTNQVITLAR